MSNLVNRLRGSRLESIGTLIVVAAALRYWLLYFHRSTNLLDEGSQAAQALRILQGDLIYRDFFTVVTPGSYYTVAWLFQLFGTELIVMRWAALAMGLGILLATLIVARHLMCWPFAAAAALMTTVWGWFLVTPNLYSWEAALFSLIALACYLRGVGSAHAPWIVFAGVATGLAALMKQNVGVYTATALLLTIWLSRVVDSGGDVRGRVRRTARFVAGMCLPIVPTLWLLILAGAGPYLYESWVYYPLVLYPGRFSLPYPSFYPVLPEMDLSTLLDVIPAMAQGSIPEPAVYEVWTKLVLYLPVLVYPFALVSIGVLAFRFHRRGRVEAGHQAHALLAVSLTGLLTLLQAWPRADVTHILFGMQATFVVFGYLSFCAWRGLTTLPGPRLALTGVALLVTLAPQILFLWNGYRRTEWEYSNYNVALRIDRARGILASGIEAQRIDLITRYIVAHTAPEEPVFVVPWAAGFYFLTNRSNPTRTDFMLFEDPESYPCVIARLDHNPPKYVIYGYVWDVDGKRFRDYARPLDEYIRSRYVIEDSVDGYEVWRRVEGTSRRNELWPGACQPKRFRLRDLWSRAIQASPSSLGIANRFR